MAAAPGLTMHCDRCNVDFPEGLRYCKWCGEALVDRPRVTSELHSCPSCSAAIQPGWTFCKACGERLQPPASTPSGESLVTVDAGRASADSSETAVFALCSSCGESLDTGSLYCKGCGSAVYTEQKPFGGSALLCEKCKSYSPLGSRECRVCGAPFAQASRTVVDFPNGLTTVQQKAPTLPDLDQRMAGNASTAEPEQANINSGANTWLFTDDSEAEKAAPPKGVETNLLPGTAGGRSEQQSPTQIMKMGRITGPVDAEEARENLKPSGELPPPKTDQSINEQPGGFERTIEFAAVAPPPTANAGEPTTLGLGSDKESDTGSEVSGQQTKVFVSPLQTPPPTQREEVSSDEGGTRPITAAQPPPGVEATREFQANQKPAAAQSGAESGGQSGVGGQPTISPTGAGTTTAIGSSDRSQSQQIASPVPKKRTGVVVASVIVVALLLGAAGYVAWLLLGRGNPTPSVTPPVAVEPAPPSPPVPEKPPAPLVPEGMVALAAGSYTIGRDGADPLEQPEHRVDLRPFFIDRTEVTNAAYKAFVDATGHKPPSNWAGTSFPEGRGDFPVTGVTWQDAADFAAWAGKRLPTEAEWEAAARGTDGRIYPWGNGFRSGVANIGVKPDKPTPEQYPAGIRASGSYPEGASPVGAVDMIGNAWEWVSDEIKVYPGNNESTLELEPGVTYRVIRGGAYDGNKVNDATYRGYLNASLPYPKVGFRCAKDAK